MRKIIGGQKFLLRRCETYILLLDAILTFKKGLSYSGSIFFAHFAPGCDYFFFQIRLNLSFAPEQKYYPGVT